MHMAHIWCTGHLQVQAAKPTDQALIGKKKVNQLWGLVAFCGMGLLVGFLHRRWLIHWMGSTGQAGFLFVPSSFPGLKAAFKRRLSSNCVPLPPQNVFSKSFYCDKLGHFFFFFKVFFRFPVLLSGPNSSCAGICLLNSQQSRNLKRVLCYPPACWTVILGKV